MGRVMLCPSLSLLIRVGSLNEILYLAYFNSILQAICGNNLMCDYDCIYGGELWLS
jgi:hypothetical protein